VGLRVLVVDLQCEQGHGFEGWFASADDLSGQQARGLLTCPVCGELRVTRRPSAPHLNVSHLKREAAPAMSKRHEPAHAPAAPSSKVPNAVDETPALTQAQSEQWQALYFQAVKQVIASTEDVGEHFAQEARSIHHGDAPARAIRGQTTPQEREALRDEGIEVVSLPIPDSLKGPVQ
jgi:hypothetical protein